MNKLKRKLIDSSILFSVPLLPLSFQIFHDYIDAGTGSIIIQFIIAGLVGGLFLLKVFWIKIKTFFVNFPSKFK